jgi:hypothetical protein
MSAWEEMRSTVGKKIFTSGAPDQTSYEQACMSVYFAAGALVVHGHRPTFIKPECLLEVATNENRLVTAAMWAE